MLLLRSALGEGEEVGQAWSQWRNLVEWEEVDYASIRLLPLVYRNLRSHHIEDPLLPRLKGVYLRSLYQQSLLFARVREFAQRCRAQDLDCLFLKGAPLSLLYYGGIGLRPMGDVDILVRRADVPKAVQVLEASGWEAHREGVLSLLGAIHACPFWIRGPEYCIDLHWTAVEPADDVEVDEGYWADPVEFEFAGTTQKTISPTNQFFHSVVHGFPGNEMPTLRWIPDALMVLRSSPIEWENLLKEARNRVVSARCAIALAFLVEEFRAQIPRSVIESLQQASEKWFDRRHLELSMRNPAHAGPAYVVEMFALRSLRSTRGQPLKAARIFFRMLKASSSHSGKSVLRWGLSRTLARLSNLRPDSRAIAEP